MCFDRAHNQILNTFVVGLIDCSLFEFVFLWSTAIMEVFSTVFIDRPKFIVCTGLFVDILYKISPDLMNVSLLFHSPGILSHSRSAASQPERSILPVIATFFRWWYSSFVLQPIFASVAVRNRGSKVDGRTFATVQKPWACTMKSIVASFSQEEHLNWCGNVSCIDAENWTVRAGRACKKRSWTHILD